MANRMRKRYRYRYKIYMSMILAAALPVIILGLYSYHTYITELSQRKDLMMQVTASQVKNRVENILDSIKQYYCEVENKEEIKTLISADDLYYNQYSRLKESSSILSGPVYLREYVQAYTFINMKQDWVVSNYGMYRYDEIKDTQEMLGIQSMIKDRRVQCYWINGMGQEKISVLPAGRSIVLSDYVLMLRLPMLSVEDRCLLLVNLNGVKLRNLMSEDLGDMDIAIIDARGDLVYTSNSLMSDYCISNMDAVNHVNGCVDVRLADGTEYRLSATLPTVNGLIYIAGYNVTMIKEGADQILSLAGVLLLVIVLVLIVIHTGAGMIYKPVSRLTTQFCDILKNSATEVDEITMLENGFTELVANKELMEQMIEGQKEMLVELFLTRLIRGELSQEMIDESVERFGLKRNDCYIMLSVGVSEKERILDVTEKDALTITIVGNMPDELKKIFFVKPIIRNNIMHFILGADEEAQLEQKTEKVFEQISDYIYNTYNCYVHCGVSRVFGKLKHLRAAYNEGVEALKNSKSVKISEVSNEGEPFNVERTICYYSDLSKDVQASCRYDLYAEQEMRKAVDACREEAAFEIVDKFMNRLLEKGVSRQERYFFMHRFLDAILQVASDAGLSMNQIFECEEDNLFLTLDSIVEPENIKEFYKSQIIKPVIMNLTQYRRSPSADILERVLTLVKEKNGDITLAECAEQLNYHPSYIWRVLKTEKNMTFTDYVALEKLEMAKDMLLQTTLSVAEIAQRLNYTNTQNFIRFFSKHEGTTPGKYRQEHKNIAEKE